MATSNETVQGAIDSIDNIDDIVDDVEIELEASDEDDSATPGSAVNPNVTDQLNNITPALSLKERWDKVIEADPELKDYESDQVKKRVGKLTWNWREQERQTNAAVEYAESMQKENNQLKSQQYDQQGTVINEHVGRIKASLENAKKDYEDAFAANDPTSIAEANAQVATLAAQLANAETHHNRFKKTTAPVDNETVVATHVQQNTLPEDGDNEYSQQQSPEVDPKAEDWATRNEWFGTDKELTTSALTIHRRMVTQEGYLPNTDAYYAELDSRIERNFPGRTKAPASTTPVNVAPATVAAVNSQTPVGGAKPRGTKLKLTASQVQMAKRLGVTLTDYAKQVANLAKG